MVADLWLPISIISVAAVSVAGFEGWYFLFFKFEEGGDKRASDR